MHDASPARRLAVAAGLLLAVIVACGREITGPATVPASLFQRTAAFAFEPKYETAIPASALRAALTQVAFERVRITLRRDDGSIAFDTVVFFPAGADELTLTLNVPLPPTTPASGAPLNLNLGYVNAAGDTVFRGGPVRVTVMPTVSGGTTSPPTSPVQIPVQYTGTGASATAVVIAPKVVNGTAGQSTTFTAQALGSSGQAIPGTPVVFTSSNTAVVTVDQTSGAATLIGRGTAKVYALLLTGPKDSATVTVTLPASRLAAVSGDGQSAFVNERLPQPIVVRVTASDGVGVGGVPVGFSPLAGGSAGAANAVTAADGTASTTWTLGSTAGAQQLSVAAPGLQGSPLTFNATARAAVPTALVMGVQPLMATAGKPMAAVQVRAVDDAGNLVTGYTGTVTAAFNNSIAGSTLSGTTSVAAVGGIATFANLSVNKPGTAYALRFTASGLTPAVSGAFDVIPGPAVRLVFTSAPTSGDAVSPLGSVVVTAQDDVGNTATGFAGIVTISIIPSASASLLAGTLTRAASAGVATFSDLRVTSPLQFSLAASTTGLTGATSAPITITTGPPTTLALERGGSQTAVVGSTLDTIVVRLTDAGGNAVSGVPVAFAVTVGGGAVSPTTTLTDAAGRARTLWTIGFGAQAMTATAAGVAPVTVTATGTVGAATQLRVITGPPTTLVAGALSPAISAEVLDARGNRVTTYNTPIVLSIASGPAGAGLLGQTSVTPVAGVATFADISLTIVGAYVLKFTSGNLPALSTTSLVVTPAAAASIAADSGASQTGIAGTVLAKAFVVFVADRFGTPVPGTPVTWAVASGGGLLNGTTSTTDVNGRARTTLTLGNTAGSNVVTATSAGLTGSPVTFTATSTAATPAVFRLSTAPAATWTAGVSSPTFSAEILDAVGNRVTTYSTPVVLSIASGPAGATLFASTTVTPANGVASFQNVMVQKAGAYTLRLASGDLPAITTAGITVLPGPAAKIVADSGNAQSGAVSSALGAPFVVFVTDAYGNPVSGTNITWTVTSGGGAFGSGVAAVASLTTTTDATGRARTTLTLGASAGANTVTATAAGLVGSPVTFTATATAGAATQLVITQQPPASSAAGASFTPALTVAAKDTAGNLVTSFTSAIAVAIGTNPAGGTLGGTASVSAVGGIATFSGLSINKVGTGYTLAFSSSGLTGATTSAFNITPAVASLIAADSGGATQTGPAGQRLPTQLVVKVTDALGNKVSGATVTWAVVTGGGSLDSMTTVTDTGGRARAQWTLGAADSVQTVTATSGTLTGSPVTFSAIVTSVAYLSVVSNGLWSDSNTWSPLGHPTAFDDVTIGGVGSVRLDTLAAVAIRHLTFGPGSISLRGGSLQVRGDVTGTGGGLNGGTLTIIGGTHSLTLDYATNLFIGGGGVVSLGSFLTASGDVTVSGANSALKLNGNELDVNGFFATAAGGTVSLTSASDRLWVYAGATFGGGSTAGKLTNGFLTVVGDFTQSGAPDSFAPDSAFFTFIGEPYPEDLLPLRSSRIRTARAPGIAKLRALDVETARSARAQRSAISRAARAEQLAQFDRIRAAAFARRGLVAPSRLQAAQGGGTERAVLRQGRRTRNYSYTGTSIITFANPTTSFFGALSLAGTSYMLGSDVTVAEWLEDYSGVWQGMVSSDATPRTITSHGADVGKLRFDNVRWILLDGNAVWAMDYVEFDNMDPTVDQFTVARTSDERDACECNPYYELWYWSFFTTPTTGNYIKATDTNGEPNVVELYMTDTYPGVHGGHIAKAGGAMITSWLHSGVFVSNSDSDDISHFNGQYSSTDTATTIGGCDEPRNPAVSPNGKLFAVPCRFSGKVAFFDPVTSNFVSAVSDTSFHEPYAVAFSGDGTELWVSNKNSSTVSIVNVASGLVVAVVSPPLLNSPEGITIAAGKAFVASRGNGKVIIIDVATRAVLNSVVVGGYPRDAAGTPDGQWVYVTTDAGSVAKVKVSDGTVTQLTITGSSRNITISPDGLKIYVATENSAVAVIVVATDAVSQITFSGASNTYGVAILKDGSMGFATDSDLDKVFAFNPATGLEVTDYPFPFYVGYGPRGIVAY